MGQGLWERWGCVDGGKAAVSAAATLPIFPFLTLIQVHCFPWTSTSKIRDTGPTIPIGLQVLDGKGTNVPLS